MRHAMSSKVMNKSIVSSQHFVLIPNFRHVRQHFFCPRLPKLTSPQTSLGQRSSMPSIGPQEQGVKPSHFHPKSAIPRKDFRGMRQGFIFGCAKAAKTKNQ